MKDKMGYMIIGLSVLAIGLGCAWLTGCRWPGSKPTESHPEPSAWVLPGVSSYTNNNPRISLERIAVIYDTVAYNNCRGVYLIKDSKTGQEFIGISGIGISELGSHLVRRS